MSDEVPIESVESAEAAVTGKSVARLFPFVVKTRGLLVGRDTLRANKSKLHFVLIATDIAESSREEVLKDFSYYPVVQHFTGADFEKFFAVKGAKAIGFTKSGLAQSIYAELKSFRLNKPPNVPTPPKPKPAKTSVAPITPSENP
jgi:hypothetical protein